MFTKEGFAKTWQYITLFEQGLVTTLSLSALTVIFGFMLALILAVMRLSDLRPLRALGLTRDGRLREQGALWALSRFNPVSFLATAYVEVFRATPMLVQLFIIYYVVFAPVKLPAVKLFGFIRFERFLPGVVALSMNSGAYLCEIIRSG
ncbi:MAG: ABC transporter permease subunit, partial [Oscillospiraceae bacterium]|nr:ABC transporter permease subunit [Oscillospiraceae bacterium]